MPQYSIYVSCNQCGGEHPMGVSIYLNGGPVEKRSIADVYQGEPLPPQVSAIQGHPCLCLKTGKRFIQQDNAEVFLVPVQWRMPIDLDLVRNRV